MRMKNKGNSMKFEEITAELMKDSRFVDDLLGELTVDHPSLFIDMIHGNDLAREAILSQYEQMLESWTWKAIERGEFGLTE